MCWFPFGVRPVGGTQKENQTTKCAAAVPTITSQRKMPNKYQEFFRKVCALLVAPKHNWLSWQQDCRKCRPDVHFSALELNLSSFLTT